MENSNPKPSRWREWVAAALLLAVYLLPRSIDLDRFLTIDEGLWMYHSSQFYYALGQREFENTFQRFHPGVPMMWAGTLGFLVEYPEFRGIGQGYLNSGITLGKFLKTQGVDPLDLVVAGRKFMIAQNAALFLLAFWVARKLLPLRVAAPAFALISLEPFFLSLTYILQMDGLMASYMFVSMLALLAYLYAPKRNQTGWRHKSLLVLSGVMGGLGILTKAPAVFVFLFAGLMLLIELIRRRDYSISVIVHRLALPLAVWIGSALVVMVIVWPALWVDPIGFFNRILTISAERLTEGIGFRLFFNGVTAVGGDFPWYFYPYSFAWRSSPVALVGIAVTMLAWIRKWGVFKEQEVRRLSAGMALAGLFFTIQMGLGALKMDRYIIPVHLCLALVSILGWIAAGQRLSEVRFKARWWEKARQYALVSVLLILFLVQIGQVAGTFPYYYAYYNPLFGGTKGAEEMFWLGWGEGLEEVGAYLNTLHDANKLNVMALHAYGPLSYYFIGKVTGSTWPSETAYTTLENMDYVVIYVSERQTNYQRPLQEVLLHYQPEFVVTINGVDYARLYALADLTPADWDYLRTSLDAAAH